MSGPAAPRRKLIVVANRAPVSYERAGDERTARRGGGGLVTALGGLLAHHDVTWIASAMTAEDRVVAAEHPGGFAETTRDGAGYRLRLVAHEPETYDRFYHVLANPTLWFLQHYLWGLGVEPDLDVAVHDAWTNGYVPVNEAFAAATLDALEREPDAAVFFHDYHLYLAPALVRARLPDVVTSHFVHIPWPEPDYWHVLPAPLRRAIHEGLRANDVVGFHTAALAAQLPRRAARRSPAPRWTASPGGLEHEGRARTSSAHPIGIDPGEFEALRDDDPCSREEQELVERRPEQLVAPRRPHRSLEERRPRLPGLWAAASSGIPSSRAGSGCWPCSTRRGRTSPCTPSTSSRSQREVRGSQRALRHGRLAADRPARRRQLPPAIAGYKQFDVLLVNPIFDGMNLVAKEAPFVNDRDGVRRPLRERRRARGPRRVDARRSTRSTSTARPTRSTQALDDAAARSAAAGARG